MYTLTSHRKKAGFDLVFTFAFAPVLGCGTPPALGPVSKPGKVLGAAHALEQKM